MKPTATLSLAGAADYLNTSETVMSELLSAGDIPAAKIGKEWVVRISDLDDYLAQEVELQSRLRREAHMSGKEAKVPTAFGRFKERQRVAVSAPTRKRGAKPALPGFPRF